MFLQYPPHRKGSEHGLGAPDLQLGRARRDLGHCWPSKLFCASPCSVAHGSSSSLLQGSPLLPWGWGSLGMPLGSCTPSLHCRPCCGAAPPPSQALGKGSSGVTAIDISSAGSPSGSDGILEHGNGSCLVEKANLPQLYRISAGVLQLSLLPPALQPAKEQTRFFKAAAVQFTAGPGEGELPPAWPRGAQTCGQGFPANNWHPGWHHTAQAAAAAHICWLKAEKVMCPPASLTQGWCFPRERRRMWGRRQEGCGPLRVPPASVGGTQACAAGKSRGASSLLLIWLFWQRACCPVGLAARGLARFTHP